MRRPAFKDTARNSQILARQVVRADQLVGLTSVVIGEQNKRTRYGSALLVHKDGTIGERFDKMHRVPFGEYVPFRDVLPFMNALAPYDHDYSIAIGEKFTRFPLGDRRFGTLICYEDTDPFLARRYVQDSEDGKPVDFLVNMSNDGWFDGSAEHDEHLVISRFRAIECRRCLVRAVNQGISAVIDGNGRVLKPRLMPHPDLDRNMSPEHRKVFAKIQDLGSDAEPGRRRPRTDAGRIRGLQEGARHPGFSTAARSSGKPLRPVRRLVADRLLARHRSRVDGRRSSVDAAYGVRDVSEPRFTWWQLVWRPVLRGLRSLAVIYVGVLVVLLLLENYLVYPGTTASQSWLPPPIDEIQEVDLVAESGTKLHGWWLPCPGSERTLLYFHGNGGNLSHRGGSMLKLRKILDTSVFIVGYPGYGKSQGSTTEAGCYESATAAYDWLTQTQNRDPKRMILYGASLGGAVAVELATRKPHGAVVLAKTFTSLPDVATRQFPWLPVRWLMRNRMPSVDRIRSIDSPVFIAHGDADRLVPFALGQQLFAAAAEPKMFVRLAGTGSQRIAGGGLLPCRSPRRSWSNKSSIDPRLPARRPRSKGRTRTRSSTNPIMPGRND